MLSSFDCGMIGINTWGATQPWPQFSLRQLVRLRRQNPPPGPQQCSGCAAATKGCEDQFGPGTRRTSQTKQFVAANLNGAQNTSDPKLTGEPVRENAANHWSNNLYLFEHLQNDGVTPTG